MCVYIFTHIYVYSVLYAISSRTVTSLINIMFDKKKFLDFFSVIYMRLLCDLLKRIEVCSKTEFSHSI